MRDSRCRFSSFAALFLLSASTAWGFCPKNGFRCAFGILGGMTHEDITRTSVKALDAEFFSTSNLTKSMKKAIDEIVNANADVDQDQHTAAKHFDGESFGAGQSRVLSLLSGILSSLQAQDGQGARRQLGQALHTIQDFYAHSNWIELGNGGANPQLGRPGAISPVSAPTESTCDACTECNFGCQSNLITANITSGYYGGEDTPPPISTKCRHGGLFDSGSGPSGGINKDVEDCTLSPHNLLHSAAAGAAVAATEQFIRDIHDQVTLRQLKLLLGVGPTLVFTIDTTGSMGDIIGQVQAQAVQIVNDRLGTDQEPVHYVLAPFNDPATGPVTSTDDAPTFIGAIEALTADGGGDCPELSMTGTLQGIGAADEGADDFIFTDADSKDADLADTVSSLAVTKDVKIYPAIFGSCAFATASPAAVRRQSATRATAMLKGQTGRAFAAAGRRPVPRPPATPGAITLGDPTYVQVATDSGGQRFFLQRNEAGLITSLANSVVRANAVDILAVADALSGAPMSYSVPVDSTLTSTTFSVSGTPTVTLTRPDGTVVAPTDPGVTFLALSSGAVYTVAGPATGSWTATLNGDQNFSLNVSGEGTLSFDAFSFVEVGGRPGHQGFFTIPGFPIAGATTTAAAELSGSFSTAQFDLRNRAGTVLETLSLTPEPSGTPGQFFGAVSLPTSPFVAYVTGQDANNVPFQRVLAKSLPPQTVSVTPPQAQDLAAGGSASYVFTVQNFGPADNFSFSAADDQGFVSAVSPATLSLATNGSATATVQLQVPSGFMGSTSDTLTATVVGAATGARNFAVVDSTVSFAPPIDCSHAQPSVATLWPPNHKLATVAIQGIAQPATIQVTGVLQNEPTNGQGDGDTCPDATGLGASSVQLRAERSGSGSGRVYQINFTATTPSGSSCQGSVQVCVPHNHGAACPAATPTIDSTLCP